MSKDYFTAFLDETSTNVKGDFSTLKWLELMDKDTLAFLQKQMDQFDHEIYDAEEALDIINLVKKLSELENGDIDDTEILIQSFFELVVMESLKRKGLVKIEGCGKISKPFSFNRDWKKKQKTSLSS